MRRFRPMPFRLLLSACLLVVLAMDAARAEPYTPPALQNVGIDENLGASIPADLTFTDSTGQTVALKQYLNNERPVVLNLVYYTCPMLCDMSLNALNDGLKELKWTPGDQFEIVTVSIDPKEQHQLAEQAKANYIEEYGRPEAARGWHWHVGEQENITKLADAVGFRYNYVENTGEYSHASAIMILTPEGKISRYLDGFNFRVKDLRLALFEAADGTIGSVFEQFFLNCYHFDPGTQRYVANAMLLMRIGGIFTIGFLGLLIGCLVLLERRKRRLRASHGPPADDRHPHKPTGAPA